MALERLAMEIARGRRRGPATLEKAVASTDPTTGRASSIHSPGLVLRSVDAPWCPESVVVPPGEFVMGAKAADLEASDREKPQHLVRIRYPMAVGRYPVVFDEYDHFARATRREWPGDEDWGRARRPVINVSWDDAKAYVEWLASETGQPYPLLSEAEWEYACRAGSTTPYNVGETLMEYDANFGQTERKTVEVGAYSLTCSPGPPSVDMRVRHQETDDEEEPVRRGTDHRRAA
jgi:formylglycine-generating enzyme required for sulfatase activity